MFAIFLMESMQPFYDNVTSFPTAIFSFFLIFSLFFWCVAMLGLIDLDIVHIEMPDLEGMDGSHSSHHSDLTHGNILGGILLKFGLEGVPITIIISLISLIGWFFSYYAVYLSFDYLPFQWMQYVAGIPIFLLSLYLGIIITAQCIKPLRPLFKKLNEEPTHKTVLGQVAVVKTLKVTESFGEASYEDGGAGLVLKIRCDKDNLNKFTKGDRVILLEYLEPNNAYRVISEAEFKN